MLDEIIKEINIAIVNEEIEKIMLESYNWPPSSDGSIIPARIYSWIERIFKKSNEKTHQKLLKIKELVIS